MASAIVFDLQNPAPIVGPTVVAQMSYGDDGPANGPDAEVYVGDNSGNGSTARDDWDGTTNADGSWTSRWVTVTLDLPPGGGINGAQLEVNGASESPLYYGGVAYSGITDVVFASGATTNGSVTWADINVDFAKDLNVVDSYSSDTGPAVDQTTAAAPSAEQVETITPDTASDSVVIQARFQLTLAAGTYPNPDDLFSSIMIGTSD